MQTRTPLYTTILAIVKAAHQEGAFLFDQHFHLSIANAPYERLVIEAWDAPDPFFGRGERRISIAHYYDDGEVDIDMELFDNGCAVAVIATQNGASYRRCYWRRDDGQLMQDSAEIKDSASFARVWARNIKAQGFIEAAKKIRMKKAA